MERGKLTQNRVHLQDHEWKTVKFFLEQGKDIELIPKSQIAGFHLGDFMMDGLPWEVKAPIGDGKKNIENKFSEAAQQSSNIIIDLHRSKMKEADAFKGYVKEFKKTKSVRRMKIITKSREVLDFRK